MSLPHGAKAGRQCVMVVFSDHTHLLIIELVSSKTYKLAVYWDVKQKKKNETEKVQIGMCTNRRIRCMQSDQALVGNRWVAKVLTFLQFEDYVTDHYVGKYRLI